MQSTLGKDKTHINRNELKYMYSTQEFRSITINVHLQLVKIYLPMLTCRQVHFGQKVA